MVIKCTRWAMPYFVLWPILWLNRLLPAWFLSELQIDLHLFPKQFATWSRCSCLWPFLPPRSIWAEGLLNSDLHQCCTLLRRDWQQTTGWYCSRCYGQYRCLHWQVLCPIGSNKVHLAGKLEVVFTLLQIVDVVDAVFIGCGFSYHFIVGIEGFYLHALNPSSSLSCWPSWSSSSQTRLPTWPMGYILLQTGCDSGLHLRKIPG